MAGYDITHACGHSSVANINGTDVHGERGRKAKWLAGRDCPACERASRERARTQADAAAHAEADHRGWPEITGTERQRAWATTLRREAIDALAERFAGHAARGRISDATAAKALTLWTDIALRRTDARWWIDNRGALARAISESAHDQDRAALDALKSDGDTHA